MGNSTKEQFTNEQIIGIAIQQEECADDPESLMVMFIEGNYRRRNAEGGDALSRIETAATAAEKKQELSGK